MTDAAVGIHDHDHYKTGRRPPKNAPALMLADFLSGTAPAHPAAADHFGSQAFGLYGNDQYGDCGPTSVANLVRLVTGGLLGTEIQPSQNDVFDLYRRSGNPNFDPATDADDNGVDMQTMLEALLKDGIGDGKGGVIRPVAFAKVNVKDDAELDAAVSIFGGVLWGVDLMVAQQAQTDASPPKWDYKKSGEWGGHAIVNGKFNESTGDAEVISWDIDVQSTAAFRQKQLEEGWVVIWQWNIDHPAFQQGVDMAALRSAYKALTGKDLPQVGPTPVPTPPAPPAPAPDPTPPSPDPSPADATDRALWEAVSAWTAQRHVGANHKAAVAVRSWAETKGLDIGEVGDVEAQRDYPYEDNLGPTTVLGPEIFASADGSVICWKGQNYVRQAEPVEVLPGD